MSANTEQPPAEQFINSIAILDSQTGSHVQYEGPFKMIRDGGYAEVFIPVDDDAGIAETTAENLAADRTGDIAVVIADGRVESSGVITIANFLKGDLIVLIDDGNYTDPSEVDVDPEEVADAE